MKLIYFVNLFVFIALLKVKSKVNLFTKFTELKTFVEDKKGGN